ncbi:MAG TPA: DUF6352 family protein [Rubrivivax sp.]
MQDFWPSSGFNRLRRNERGWLAPSDDYLRLFLERPELALVEESCVAEIALHEALVAQPARPVGVAELDALVDDDARANYRLFLAFRDGLLAVGTVEGCYLGLFRAGRIEIPPLFVDLLAQAILRNVLDDATDATEARAAEMLFRPQRITRTEGRVLAGDREVLDLLNETRGLGDIGRLLVQANAPVRAVQLEVLGADNAASYWASDTRYNFLLDLTHETTQDLGHGVQFRMTRKQSGLKALAAVLEKWVVHLLGVAVAIRPEQRIDDPQWRWHVGLDAESTALLNDLYEDKPVAAERMERLLSLFRLDFSDPVEMRADVAGKPVYLGLCSDANGGLRLKPQNLLLNLPLSTPS